MNAPPALGRPLTGDAGYARLIRLLARAFYAGECPPKDVEPDDIPAGARTIRRDKNEYKGLGVLLLDLLAAAHGYVKDVAILSQLGVSGKVANRALRHLQAEGLLQSEVTKIKVRRQNADQPDDAELEVKMSQQTNTWWSIAYPALLDSLHLRLHRMRAVLRRHMGDGEDVLEYLCRRCGATYTSLDAMRLLDPMSGAFHCEECRGELEANVDVAGLGGAGTAAGPAASRQQLQAYAKRMLERMEQQLRPVLDQLDRLKDVPPPDFGSLRDWHQKQHDLARRRQEAAARARQKMAGRGLAQEHMDDDQVLDWLAQAEVQVELGGGGAAAAAAAGPGKELPAWFRGAESESVGPAASQDLPGGEAEQQAAAAAAAAADADEQRRLQEAFLAQYLAQVQAAAAAPAGVDEEGKSPDAKRVKRENGWAPGVKAEVAAEGVELEALGLGGLKPEQQQQQQQEAAAAEAAGEVLWEDVKEEQAAAEDGGEADEADEADEWEDI
ncbi:general transcription factor IIE subunit 1 [Micractinium conductrix]|uniref:General transcription factor IIE subunit 1 n=1 Tax=Micractinium conductrix TaxID=554055 RepID=A0A2P6VNX4_9CHLO|nr:general transcription factor IIE subunit 1 [Micractinium conductrix]|eukprot:PSC75801.1 general transcription factor IIE subunit 1 [Micractinium conductrix]